MHQAFNVLLASAKTSKFVPVKPKRTIQKKQPLVSPGAAAAAAAAAKAKFKAPWDEPTDNYYCLVKGELCYKRDGVWVHGVTGNDEWAHDKA
jgi:hypothetical protein